jgi:hypothetical protein
VTFSNGTEGWAGVGDGQGGSWIDGTGGKGSPTYHTQIYETFGLNWVTRTNQAFVGNYGEARSVTLGIDLKPNSVTYDGIEVSRHLVVELRDYHNPYGNMPYTSVWYDLGDFGAVKPGWQHMSVTIPDTTSTTLPNGWGGYGSGGVSLPPGRTFADVLSHIDEVAFGQPVCRLLGKHVGDHWIADTDEGARQIPRHPPSDELKAPAMGGGPVLQIDLFAYIRAGNEQPVDFVTAQSRIEREPHQ